MPGYMGKNTENKHIVHLRHTLLGINTIILMVGIALICLCLWLRFDPDVREWISQLKVYSVYIGLYILIIAAIITLASGVLGCISTMSDSQYFLMYGSIAVHLICFVIGISGAAVLVDYSTYQSSVQPVIRDVMLSLINLSPVNTDASQVLSMVQENMGCCGANGPEDYINLRRSLPTQCRDTVTGNAFYYGCAEELTFYMEKRSTWVVAIACVLAFLNVMSAALTLVLIQADKQEQKMSND